MYTWETQTLGQEPNRLAADKTVVYAPGRTPPIGLAAPRVRDAAYVRNHGLAAQNVP